LFTHVSDDLLQVEQQPVPGLGVALLVAADLGLSIEQPGIYPGLTVQRDAAGVGPRGRLQEVSLMVSLSVDVGDVVAREVDAGPGSREARVADPKSVEKASHQSLPNTAHQGRLIAAESRPSGVQTRRATGLGQPRQLRPEPPGKSRIAIRRAA
jgi:hypothetical protein